MRAVIDETVASRFRDNLTRSLSPAYSRTVKTMPVGEFKARFAEVVEEVRRGEEIVISYGRKRENVAVLIPYAAYRHQNGVTLGLLRGKARAEFADDFEMTDEELTGE